MAKFHFTIFCLFISLVGFSQKTVILDSITNAPIAFVRVSIPGSDTYQLSNSKGEISLDSLWMKSNTLSVFCYGYVRRTISNKQTTIYLSPMYKELNESKVVVAKRRYGHKKLGEEDYPSKRDLNDVFGDVNVLSGKHGENIAVWIPNHKSLKGYLEKVNVYLISMGVPTSYFRLHFYACSKIKLEPGEEITSQNLIAKGTTGNEWVIVDVSTLMIPISENGIFVGIEWFDSEDKDSYLDTVTYKSHNFYIDGVKQKNYQRTIIFKGNGIVIGQVENYYRLNKHKNWRIKNGNWIDTTLYLEYLFKLNTINNKTQITPNNLVLPIPCINVDVKYIKQKNESEFEDPKKRKLNRIEKVKEENFIYPQNTISELFSSLEKAIEKNELIYVLKYLCVYKDDQLDDILDDVKQWEGKLSPIDQESCLKWIKHFQAGLTEKNISFKEGNEYVLNVNGEMVYLLHENGKWKLNPYSSRIYNIDSSLE